MKLTVLHCNRDSYWIVRGLLLCGMETTVKGMISNMAHLIDRYNTCTIYSMCVMQYWLLLLYLVCCYVFLLLLVLAKQ